MLGYSGGTVIPASHPFIRCQGRHLINDQGQLLFDWPATRLKFRCQAQKLILHLYGDGVWMDIRVNGRPYCLNGSSADASVQLSQTTPIQLQLDNGVHSSVSLVQRSECHGHPITFCGIELGSGALAPPETLPDGPSVCFIGDSYMAGYGNLTTNDNSPLTQYQVDATTHSKYSLAAVCGQALNADWEILARSGLGLVRNYGGNTDQPTLPELLTRQLHSQPHYTALPEKKDVVVIALGTNDFSTPITTGESYSGRRQLIDACRHRFHQLVHDLWKFYQQPQFVLLGIPRPDSEQAEVVQKIASELASDYPVHYLALTELNQNGGDAHPDIHSHKQAGITLARTAADLLQGDEAG